MNWSLPKNSIFATLLRSPWWVSVVIAFFLSALTAALLPDRFKAVGVVSSFPFLVIGLIAAWRQSKQPSAAALEEVAQKYRAMDWAAFSAHLEGRLNAVGNEVARCSLNGADLEAIIAGRKTLICARRWKSARTGVDALRQLKQAAEHVDAHDCVYVTLGEVSEAALSYATAERIKIWREAELLKLG
jgi:restriction system protein